MKKSNAQPLKEIISEYLDALKMKQKLREVSLISSWEKHVGKTIARATREIYIKDRILYVVLNSSVVRNELLHLKSMLLEQLNSGSPEKVIDDIMLK